MFVQFNWLKFKNVRSYPNTETKIDFNKGLTLITGTNGVGKTSMMEALSFCLYGKPYTKIKIGELINRYNKKGLHTECQFSIGKDVYNIIRGLKPSILSIKKNGNALELLSASSLSQDDIDKILGVDYKMFKNIISLSASNKPFLDKDTSKAERRAIIETIFNINIFADMLKILKKDINVLKTDIEIEESNIKILEESISTDRTRLDEIKLSQKNFKSNKESDIAQLESQIKSKKLDVKNYKEEIEEKKAEIIEDKKILDEKIDKLETTLSLEKSELAKKINDYQEESKEALKNYDTKIAEIESEIENKSKIVNTINNDIDNINNEYDAKVSKLEDNYESVIKDIENKIKDIDVSDKAEIKSNIEEHKVNISFLNEKIKENKNLKVFYENNDVCSQCKHEIDETEKIKLIKELEESNADFNSQIKANTTKLNKSQKELDIINTKIDEKRRLEDKLESAEDIKDNQIIKMRSNKNETISELKDKLNETNLPMLESSLDVIKSNKEDHASNVEKEIESIKNASDIREIETKLKSLKEVDVKTSINNQIKTIKDSILNVKSTIINAKEKIDEIEKREFDIDIETMESEFKDKTKNYKTKYAEYKKDTDKILVYNLTKDILSDGGIKTFFFKKLIPILNQKINIYLDKFNLPISLSFDDEMKVSISSLSSRDEDINYNSFSGGERKRIDMSILFSFIDVTKILSNWNSNIIMADELFDSGIDSNGLNNLLGSMKEMLDKSKNLGVYIVSHKINEDQSGFFDSIWKIEKENQFSKLTIE